jgi:hypothetical protein
MEVSFTAELWAHGDDPGSWHFVTLPRELADEIRDEAGPRRGFGSIRVAVRLGDSRWETSLFPASGSGSMVLPVKKAVRVAEGVEAGDACTVEVSPVG